jgi:AI-2 transport protein TqsA
MVPIYPSCNPDSEPQAGSKVRPGVEFRAKDTGRRLGGMTVNEPSNDSPADGITGALDTLRDRPTFLRVMLVLAATVVVLVGMRLAAPVLNTVLFAVVLSLLVSPVYSWLRLRGIPTPLALVTMLVGLTIVFLGLFFILAVSITRFTAGIGSYATQVNEQLSSVQTLVDRLGLQRVDVRDVLQPSALARGIGVILSGIAGFLSNLFLILMIMLFLLAEGPSMMDRLRASTGGDHPRVERLTFVGHSVVRQFGLRAVINLATGAGVAILLFVLGVDFPLMWGILTFFFSFVPYIGLVLAVAPAVLLALAQFGVSRALLVIAGWW